jgi:hypothetical protein
LDPVLTGTEKARLFSITTSRRLTMSDPRHNSPTDIYKPQETELPIPQETAMLTVIENPDATNPFDPASLRLNQSFADTVGVKKLLTTVPVRKPNRQEFVRVRSESAFRLTPAAVIELKEDREVYLVRPDILPAVPGEFATVTLFTAISRQGTLFLWPVKLPNPDGRHNEWHRSAAEGAERAMEKWVKVTASMSLGAYEISEARGELSEPIWPDYPFGEILKIAFRDRLVDRADHALIQRLQGIM